MPRYAHYVVYDDKIPSRRSLKIRITLGVILAVGGLIVLGWSLKSFLGSDFLNDIDYYYSDNYQGYCEYVHNCPPPPSVFSAYWLYHHWYVAVVPVILGFAIASYGYDRFTACYRVVHQGKITALDTWSGGHYPVCWVVQIEGNTYANERRRCWRTVTAGFWRDAKVGDWVSFR